MTIGTSGSDCEYEHQVISNPVEAWVLFAGFVAVWICTRCGMYRWWSDQVAKSLVTDGRTHAYYKEHAHSWEFFLCLGMSLYGIFIVSCGELDFLSDWYYFCVEPFASKALQDWCLACLLVPQFGGLACLAYGEWKSICKGWKKFAEQSFEGAFEFWVEDVCARIANMFGEPHGNNRLAPCPHGNSAFYCMEKPPGQCPRKTPCQPPAGWTQPPCKKKPTPCEEEDCTCPVRHCVCEPCPHPLGWHFPEGCGEAECVVLPTGIALLLYNISRWTRTIVLYTLFLVSTGTLTFIIIPCWLVMAFLCWLVGGYFMYNLRLMIHNDFYRWWTFRDGGDLGGIVPHNVGVIMLIEIFFEDLPQLIIQGHNNTILGLWTKAPAALVSFILALLIVVAEFWRFNMQFWRRERWKWMCKPARTPDVDGEEDWKERWKFAFQDFVRSLESNPGSNNNETYLQRVWKSWQNATPEQISGGALGTATVTAGAVAAATSP